MYQLFVGSRFSIFGWGYGSIDKIKVISKLESCDDIIHCMKFGIIFIRKKVNLLNKMRRFDEVETSHSMPKTRFLV